MQARNMPSADGHAQQLDKGGHHAARGSSSVLSPCPHPHSGSTFSSSSPHRPTATTTVFSARSAHATTASSGNFEWSKKEDSILLRCIRGYGPQERDKALAAFAKISKGLPRSRDALLARYEELREKQTSKGQAAARMRWSGGASHSTVSRRTISSHPQRSTTATSKSGSSAAAARPYRFWTSEEDGTLFSLLRRHGRNWPLIVAEFTKAFPGTTRTKSSMSNRLVYLQQTSQGDPAEQASTSARQLSTSSTPLQDVSASLPSASASDSQLSPPPAAQSEEAWTQEEEDHLLQVALKYRHVTSILDQVEAVFDGFRFLYLDTTRSLESVHTRYCQLLERWQKEQLEVSEEVEFAEGSVGEGSSGGKGDGVDLMADDEVGHETSGEATSTTKQPPNTSATFSASASPGAHQTTVPTPSRDAAFSASPSPHNGTSSLPAQHTPAQPSSAIDIFDYDVKNLKYGFRFERLPLNTQLCIYSPSHHKLRSLPSTAEDQASGLPNSEGEDPFFVFNIMPTGSILGAVLPPHTQTHPVIVGEDGKPIEQGSAGEGRPIGVEQHFVGPCAFRVEFFALFFFGGQ